MNNEPDAVDGDGGSGGDGEAVRPGGLERKRRPWRLDETSIGTNQGDSVVAGDEES